MLLVAFLIGFAIGSPVQGYMSNKSSRKKLLIVTILCVILSLSIMVGGEFFISHEVFSIFLTVACIINGVFGNVFPIAAAAYSDIIEDFQAPLKLSFICRYGALALPFVLRLPAFYSFLAALAINLVSLFIIICKYNEKSPVPEI